MTISVQTTPGMSYAITATGPCSVVVIENNLPFPFLNIEEPGQYIAVAPGMELLLTDDDALVTPARGRVIAGGMVRRREAPQPGAASGLPEDGLLQHGHVYNLNWVPPEREVVDLSALRMEFDGVNVTSCQLWFALHPTRGKALFIKPGGFTWMPKETEFSSPGFYRFSIVCEPQFRLIRLEYFIAI